jgi:hypothetical protein
MDHCVGLTGLQSRGQCGLIPDIAFDEFDFFTGDACNPRQRFGLAVAKIIEHGDVVPGVKQFHAGVRADIAGAASDKDHMRARLTKGVPKFKRIGLHQNCLGLRYAMGFAAATGVRWHWS